MAKRTSSAELRELRLIKAFLIKRDSEICNICKHEFPKKKLIVEHKDNDHTNWNRDNLQLACQSCNIKKNPPYSAKEDIDFSHSLTQSTDQLLRPQSVEMEKNIKAEPLFRDWIKNKMTKKLRIELEEVINSGAEEYQE